MKIVFAFLFCFILSFADHYEDEYDLAKTHIPGDLSYLNLTDEQKRIIKKILSENIKMIERLHKKEEMAEKKLKRLFPQENFDKEEYKKILFSLKKEAIELEAEMLDTIHKTLTPKQRERFIEYMEEWEVD